MIEFDAMSIFLKEEASILIIRCQNLSMVSPCTLPMLDKFDRKLLLELDLNSRRSNAAIAKRLGIGKNVVNYRIQQLMKRGIIRSFYTVIDTARLGCFGIRAYVKFRRTTPRKEEEIIRSAAKNKYVWVCERADGAYSLAIAWWVRTMDDFYNFWFEFDRKYRRYFADVLISFYCEVYDFGNSCLSYGGVTKAPVVIGGWGKEQVKITELDRKILSCLSNNARMPTIEIAKKVNASPITVKNRIAFLRKSGVIQCFTVLLNWEKLGLVRYKLNFYLKDLSSYSRFIELAKTHPQTIYIDKTVGYADFEVEVQVESYAMFMEIFEDYKKTFPDEILDHSHVIYREEAKVVYFEE